MIGRAIGRAVLGRRPRAAPAKTYADFVAHITALAVDGVKSWDRPSNLSAGAFRTTTTSAAAADMFGSTWSGRWVSSFNPAARMIQHGLPSQEEYDAQIASGRAIFYRLQARGTESLFGGYSRNGYISFGSSGSAEQAFTMTELIYWDGAQAQRMQPSLGLGPTPYTW